jgi:hypothetical protein
MRVLTPEKDGMRFAILQYLTARPNQWITLRIIYLHLREKGFFLAMSETATMGYQQERVLAEVMVLWKRGNHIIFRPGASHFGKPVMRNGSCMLLSKPKIKR